MCRSSCATTRCVPTANTRGKVWLTAVCVTSSPFPRRITSGRFVEAGLLDKMSFWSGSGNAIDGITNTLSVAMKCQYSENHVIHFSPLLVEISMLVSKTISPKPQKPSGSSFLSPMSFLVFNAFTSAGDNPSSPLGSALDRIYSDHSSGSVCTHGIHIIFRPRHEVIGFIHIIKVIHLQLNLVPVRIAEVHARRRTMIHCP